MSIEEIILEAEDRMEKSVTLLTEQLRGVRTGRANVGLVDSIRVDYYGSMTLARDVVVKAHVSRKLKESVGIEWCEFAPNIVKDLLRSPSVRFAP